MSSTKQKVKSDKVKKNEENQKEKNDKFKKPKSIQVSREERLLTKNQSRKKKMADFINKKRGIIDVDSEASFSNSVSISNLSALADNKVYTIPPKQVAIISLN